MSKRSAHLERFSAALLGGTASNVFRGMAVLATGTLFARLVAVAVIPILTRVYSPEHFGLLAVYISLVSIMVPVLTLRYDMAIPLPRTDRMALNVSVLSFALLVFLSSVQATLLWLFHAPLLTLFSAQGLTPYWGLLVLGTVGATLYQALSAWATRKKAFAAVARTQASQAILGSAAKIGMGMAGIAPLGLLVGQIIQQASGSLFLARNMLQDIHHNWEWIGIKQIRVVALRYIAMPIYRLPSQVLMIFSTQAPLLFSAALFGPSLAGQLSLAILAIALPMQLFGHTLGNAYYAEIAAIGRHYPDQVRRLTFSLIWRLAALAIVPCLVLILFGRELFLFTLGDQWQQAGTFASLLAIYLAAQFVSTPLVHTMNVFDRQDLYLQINVIRSAGVSTIFATGWVLEWAPETVILVYSVALAGHYLYTLRQILQLTKPKANE